LTRSPEVGDGIRLALTFASAAMLTIMVTPLAISVARRSGFLDRPVGYKAHRAPTPYLGGVAVLAGALLAIVLFADATDRYWPLVVGAIGLCLLGTLDDRVNLSPFLRVGIEALAALLLWSEGLGWTFLASDAANLVLTVLWVIGVVNAFNLMDNLDGAAASVGAVSAACVGALAIVGDDVPLAVIGFALCGSLAGFLPYNLARPSRIFLGDGGSMPLGFLLGASLMVVPMGDLTAWSTLAAAALVVGLPLFDTALVVVSRRRRGAQIFSGATDHTTHRLLGVLKTPRAVAFALAAVQAGLCGLAIEATRLGDGASLAIACIAGILGAATIIAVEWPTRWTAVSDDV
jgi:UDP-GlcNAc:undecaprenyl-phosphate/decaprenyl-phosphate GlcNAc-1-phosphate transferase